ncbi:Gag-Pol polyprotein [Plecturocebus cupreus]
MRGNLPAQDWQIDFTHMPTHKKLCYLLTFVDTFSGWIEAFPTSRETADTVASLLTQEIIPRFGLPATIQSDNRPAFTAQVVQLVAKSLNISWKLHIPYHPQSSGKVEPAHNILKDHLAKLAIELEVYGQAELPLITQTDEQSSSQWSLVSLASSLVAAGLGSNTLGYSVTSATELKDKLRVAIEASAASLTSLQRQITSLAQARIKEISRVAVNQMFLHPYVRLRPRHQTTDPTPHSAPIQQEVAGKKRRPISSKESECKAGCLTRRPDTPTYSAPGT